MSAKKDLSTASQWNRQVDGGRVYQTDESRTEDCYIEDQVKSNDDLPFMAQHWQILG